MISGATEETAQAADPRSVQRQRARCRASPGTATEPTGVRGGHVIAVCGARGGVGATTIAVNLALELSSIAKGHVALLDLHLQNGSTTVMMGGRPGQGLRIASF